MKPEAHAAPINLSPSHQADPISYRRLVRWAFIVVRGSRSLFIVGLILSIAPIVLGQYAVSLLARIISLIGVQTVNSSIIRFAILYGGISMLLIVLQFAARIANIRSNAAMLGALQQTLHDKLLRMPASYHDRHDVSETSSMVLQEAAGCQPMLRELIAFPATQGVALASAVYFLIQGLSTLKAVPLGADLVLALVVVAVPPVAWKLASRQRVAYDAFRAAQTALASEFTNSATTPTEVQLLGAEAQRGRAFARQLKYMTGARVQAQTGGELSNQFQSSVPTILQAGFLTYAAVAAARSGGAAAGAILSIYYFVPKVIEPIDQIIRFLGGMQMLWGQAVHIGTLLDAPDIPPHVPGRRPARTATITLDHVALSFPRAQTPILRDISHVFPAGTVTALVGRSGSGKSTLLSLIDGLRMPDTGTVSIDGQPVSSLNQATLREMVAVVSQSPLFISGTVRANFQLARADATDEQIEQAARTAGLLPALLKLGGNRPLDVEVPRTPGQGLSGGERRLLAVARILLRPSKILLLDEPTTGVDQLSIGILLDGLRAACAGLTVVMVEHNLDIVRGLADHICCLENGQFTDIGTPAELAARPSLFRDLLAARERLTSTTHLDLSSVPMPTIAAGESTDFFDSAARHDTPKSDARSGQLVASVRQLTA
jgi:ABC-type multidrug transport system fused ATPase/permease subunit